MLKFNPHTTRFDHVNGLALGQAAELAYSSPEEIEAGARDWNMNAEFIEDTNTNTQCFVAGGPHAVFIAFRGTEPGNLQDMATDGNIKPVAHPLGLVHSGFKTGIDSVWPDVTRQVGRFQDRGQSIWITGHSLGGALATLAAAAMIVEDRPVHGVYTFGQPRVGDPAFADLFNLRVGGRMFRYVNDNDVVTRVPPRRTPHLGYEYSHVGAMKFFDADGVLHEDHARWFRFANTVRNSLEDFRAMLKETVGDHSMSLYVENLQRMVQAPPPADDGLGGLFGRLGSLFGR